MAFFSFDKVRTKAKKSSAGRKGTALGGFRTNLYKFGSQAGNVNAFLQKPFVQKARRNAYTAARGAGFISSVTTGDFKRKYGSTQGAIIRGSRVLTGRISGMAIQQVVPRSLGPIAGRFARQQLGKYISKNPLYQNANRKIETMITGFFNSEAIPHYHHVVSEMNIQQVMDLQLQRTHDMIRASAPDISSGQYMLGVGADSLGLNIKDKYLNQTMFDEQQGMVFDENFTIKTKMGKGRNARIQTMDIFGFTEPGQARKFLLDSIHINRMRTGKSDKFLLKGDVRVGPKRKNGTKADLFPWIWLVEYGGPIIQPVSYWDSKKKQTAVKDVKKYVPPTLFVTRSVKAVNNVKMRGAKIKTHLSMPKVAGRKNPLSYMQDVLGTRGAYGKQIKNQGMRVKRKGKIAYQNKSTFAALNRRSRGESADQGIKRGNVVGRDRRYYKYQNKHQVPGIKVHSTHGVQYAPELQDALGVSFVPSEITASINFKNVGQIKGGVSGREKFLTELITSKNPTTSGGEGQVLMNQIELLDTASPNQTMRNTQAANFIDFDSSSISGDSGIGKVSGKRLNNFIKKNFNVAVKRGSGKGGSEKYQVVFTAKTTKKSSRRSPTEKRFNKRAKRPLERFDADTKAAARRIVQNANYEEIISAASFFND